MIPKNMFFTKGVGQHRHELESFEHALRDAGVAQLNLVKVAPIFPPNCVEISREEGIKTLLPGQIAFVVMARKTSDENHRLVNAGIGCAKPSNPEKSGYISQITGYGKKQEQIRKEVELLAVSMLATKLGLQIQPKNFQESNKISEVKSIVSQAAVQKQGEFTTALALAIFLN